MCTRIFGRERSTTWIEWAGRSQVVGSVFLRQFTARLQHELYSLSQAFPCFFEGSGLGIRAGQFLDETDVPFWDLPEHSRQSEIYRVNIAPVGVTAQQQLKKRCPTCTIPDHVRIADIRYGGWTEDDRLHGMRF